MEYRRLGSSGLEVSAIGLGTSNFGRRNMGQEESRRVVREAVELGVNFIDTANTYGTAEEFVGRACKGIRDQVVLATKVSGPMGEGPNRRGASRKHIIGQVEASLRRLRTDYIDLYQLHIPDPGTPMEETLRTFDNLVRQGKVRYVGCSNLAAWQVAQAMELSRSLALAPFVSVQPEYNMLHRGVEKELVPCCEAYGLGIVPYHPLDSGFLTGKYRRGRSAPEGTRFYHAPSVAENILTESRFDILEELESYATERGHSLLELAIGWILARPAVSCVIIGASRAGQLEANVRAATWRLSQEDMQELDEILGDGS